MKLHSLTYLFVFTFSTFLLGCGEGASDVPEGTPPTAETGSDDYDQYNDAGKDGPGAESGETE